MAGKNTAVFGIYRNYAEVERGVDSLQAAGFRNTDISVLFPESTGTKGFAHEKNTKAPEGATTGVGTGAILGGGLGWLVGIGALAISRARPLYRCGSYYGSACRSRSRGRSRRDHGRSGWHGNPGIRSQALRGHSEYGGILLSVHSDDSAWTKKAKKHLGGHRCARHRVHR